MARALWTGVMIAAAWGCTNGSGGSSLTSSGGTSGAVTAGASATGSGGAMGGEAGMDAAVGSGGTTGGTGGGTGGSGVDAGNDGPSTVRQKLVWRREPGPESARAIGGTGENDVWVVGEYHEVWNSKGDGKWVRRDPGTADRMDGVWGTGPDDVYLAPRINYILHWKSGMWVKETMGIPLSVVFHECWGTGPTDIYVAGGGVMHSSGDGAWSSVTIPPGTNGIGNITGSGQDIWALGLSGLVIHSTAGGKWTAEDPGLMSSARDIWAASPNEVYVVGSSEIVHRRPDGRWVKEVADWSLSGGIHGVWGSSPQDVYVLGSNRYLFRSSGDGRWSPELIDPARPIFSLDSIWGTSAQNVYVLTVLGVWHGKPE